VAEYRMDATSWDGTADEVVDSSGNGFHGVALSTTTTEGQLCRAADLRDTGQADALELDAQALDGQQNFTLMLWYRTENTDDEYVVTAGNSSEIKELQWVLKNGDTMEPIVKDDSDGEANVGGFADGDWHHFAWTRRGVNNCLYIDGALDSCLRLSAGALSVDAAGFILGQHLKSIPRDFDEGVEGRVDEFYVFDEALNAAAIDAIRLNNLAGNNWDGSARACSPAPPLVVADYHFDAPDWSGQPGEVLDSSGNDYHGVAQAATTGAGQLCNAADLSAAGTNDYLDLDSRALDGLGDFSISLWYQTVNGDDEYLMTAANASEIKELHWLFKNGRKVEPTLKNDSDGDGNIGAFDDGTWHHFVWVRSGASNCFYVDGVQDDCFTLATGALDVDPTGFVLGQEQTQLGGDFDKGAQGLFDELIVFGAALDGADVASIYNNQSNGLNWDGTARECGSFGAASLDVLHDNAGIHCVDEPVTIRALDDGGVPVAGYAKQITLDTTTGQGSWTLSSGAGTFVDAVADDGLATYTFDPADAGVATFALSYPTGNPLVDVDVSETVDPLIADDDSEGLLAFAPTGFTVTASALANPPPNPINDPLVMRTAGTTFLVHVAAYGVTPTDPICGVIEDYAGAKAVHVWQDYVDPDAGTRVATVDDIAIATSEAAAVPQAITFAAGQASVGVKYKDAGAIRLQFKDASAPAAIRGATDAFVSRPANLRIVTIENSLGDPNPAATTSSGLGFTESGRGFVVDVDVLDAENTGLPNFGQEAAAEVIELRSAALVVPAGGRNGSAGDGTLGNGTAFAGIAPVGRWRNSSVYFDEVGIVQLQARVADADYLGTGPLVGTMTGNVGRFFPDQFVLQASSITPSCGAFTYMSEPNLTLTYTAQAHNVFGNTVENYDRVLLGAGGVADVRLVAENDNDGVDRGSRISPVATSWALGEWTVNGATDFSRELAPDGPFTGLDVGLRLVDVLDGKNFNVLDMEATTSGDCSLGPTCDARRIGTTEVYYGRITALPAIGPENVDLPVDLEAQIYSNGAFIEHAVDNCSTYQDVGMALSNYQGNLAAGETGVIGPAAPTALVGGHTNAALPALLAAPGFDNEGSVDVEFTVPGWLQYDWLGAGDINPTATATFGRYRGHDRIVYWQQDPP
jgi:hypothetical protein